MSRQDYFMARLREGGMFVASADPDDDRYTIVVFRSPGNMFGESSARMHGVEAYLLFIRLCAMTTYLMVVRHLWPVVGRICKYFIEAALEALVKTFEKSENRRFSSYRRL